MAVADLYDRLYVRLGICGVLFRISGRQTSRILTMSIQYIIVLCVIVGAAAYVGNMLWQKAKATTIKEGCGSDCGCGTKAKAK